MDTPLIISPCITHVDVNAIAHNYKHICAQLPRQAEGMCIIKSDAYGHGLVPVAKALEASGAVSFGVGTVQEGLALRQAGFTQEILILLGALDSEAMHACVMHNLLPLVYNFEGLQRACQGALYKPSCNDAHRTTEMENACAQRDAKVRIAIKFETGMSRLGFSAKEMGQVLDFLRQHTQLDVQLMVTHIACADMPEQEGMVRKQAAQFLEFCQSMQSLYPHMRRSLCNTAASLAYSDVSAQLGATVFRLGIGLYGGNPFKNSIWETKGHGLHEAMRVSTSILHIHTVQKGQSVGYGALYIAPKDMKIAVLGIGYADGFSRGLSSSSGEQAFVTIAGKAAPLCGRVCMGMVMVDVTAIPEAGIGQEAWILDGQISSAQQLAENWGTIPYEVFCLLGKNTRRYC